MKKNEKRIIIVLMIIAVIYTLIVFVLPVKKNGVFWCAWLFGMLAVAVQGYAVKIAFRGGVDGGDSTRSKFYGFPIAKIGSFYMVLQFVLSLVFILVSAHIPAYIPVILYLILLGGAAIGLISADAVRDEVERQDIKLTTDTKCMQNLRSLVYPLSSQCSDAVAAAELKKLADAFRYSDPVSSASTAELEKELTVQMNDLQAAVLEGNGSDIPELCHKINVTLTERNRLCKLGKK